MHCLARPHGRRLGPRGRKCSQWEARKIPGERRTNQSQDLLAALNLKMVWIEVLLWWCESICQQGDCCSFVIFVRREEQTLFDAQPGWLLAQSESFMQNFSWIPHEWDRCNLPSFDLDKYQFKTARLPEGIEFHLRETKFTLTSQNSQSFHFWWISCNFQFVEWLIQ